MNQETKQTMYWTGGVVALLVLLFALAMVLGIV